MKQSIHLISCFSALLLLSGCMGYRLGSSRPDGVETVYMAPVVNETTEPALELQVTEAVRGRLQFDGRLKLLNSPENADAILEVALTRYTLTAISFRTDLKTTVQQYRLRIDAVSILKDADTGETLSESKTYGETTFDFESDITTSKRDALPRAVQELAKYLVDDLIERW